MVTRPAERKRETTSPQESPDDAQQKTASLAPAASSSNIARPRRRGWLWIVMLVILGAVAWHFRVTWLPWVSIGSSDRKAPTQPRPIPVRTGTAVLRDLPLYLDQLGTVTPLNTVTVRSRVDGELMHLHFQEGEIVREGQLLAEIDPRPFQATLKQAEGQKARDEASLKLANLTVSRSRELLKTRAIAQQIVDEQAAQVLQFEAALKADAGLVENAKLQLEYCRITAPISGKVGLQIVDPGNMIRANDPAGLAVITQLQPITVVFTIPQDEIPRVLRQHSPEKPLVVDAYNRDFKTKLETGKLAALDNQIDQLTGTLRLKAVFDNKEGLLFPNQFVNVRLLVETRAKSVVVPGAAVQRGPNSVFVYVVKGGEAIERRDIKTGPAEGGETVIDSGLQPGEVVVTDGIDKLTDKSKVVAREEGERKKGRNKSGKGKEGDASPGRKKGTERQASK